MSVLQAILLGIVQGITEFLPVSSFGHLAAIENAMGITRNTAVLFEVLLHIGTMVAVFFAFHEDLRRIGEELLGMIMDIIGNVNIYFHNRKTGENLHYARVVHGTYRKFTAIMAVSFIPTALLGYICRRLVTRAAISPLLPGACILVTGVFLLVTDLSNIGGIKTPKDVTYDNAMWIGICHFRISRYIQMWNDDLCRLIMRFQQEICSEIFLSYQHSGSSGLSFSGAWTVYHAKDECVSWIYLCLWYDRGGSSWIFYDTQSAPHFAACETALFRILLFCGRSHSAY